MLPAVLFPHVLDLAVRKFVGAAQLQVPVEHQTRIQIRVLPAQPYPAKFQQAATSGCALTDLYFPAESYTNIKKKGIDLSIPNLLMHNYLFITSSRMNLAFSGQSLNLFNSRMT